MLRSLLVLLALSCASTVSAQSLENLSPADKAALHAEIRDYLLANPELVLEMIDIIKQRQADAQVLSDADMVRDRAAQLFDDGYSFVGGNPEGDITVVEFIDYRCGYCKKAHQEIADLVQGDGNIRYIIKEYPILGPESEFGARAALAVLASASPADYFRFHDALMRFNGPLNEATLRSIASDTGIDADRMVADMMSAGVEAHLGANRQLGQQMGVDGTPFFVIGDHVLRGYAPIAQMQNLVRAEREQG